MRSHLITSALMIALGLMSAIVSAIVFPEEAVAQAVDQRKVEADALRASEAERLLQQGIKLFKVSQFTAALQSWQQSLKLYREIKDRRGEGAALGNLGLAYRSLGNYAKAIEFHEQHLTIAREIKDRRGEGNSLGNLGLAYFSLGNYAKAIEFHEQSLAIARDIKDRKGEGQALGNLGLTYYSQGNYAKAIELHEQHLAIARDIKDRVGEGVTLGNLGLAYYSLGNYAKAIELHEHRLTIARDTKDRKGEGQALGNLGNVYNALGNPTKAIEFHEQRLAIARDINDRKGEGNALGNLGNVYYSLGNYAKAIEFQEQILAIARDIQDRQGEGAALGNLGIAYYSLGNYAKAIEFHEQSLAIARDIQDRQGEGAALVNLGLAYQSLGNYAKAIEFHEQSLAIARDIKDRDGEYRALNNLGRTLAKQQPELAIVFYKQSVNAAESIRQSNRPLSRDLQSSYTETVEKTYRRLADLLLKADRILEAQQVLDLLKVQELNTYLKTVRGASQPIENLPPETEILKKYNAIQTSAIALGQELATLRQTPEPSRTPQQTDRIAQLDKLQDELNQQFNQFTNRPDIQALIEALSPKVRRQTVDTADLNALRANLKQLNAVMIYPLILDDRLELIITTPDAPPLRRTVNVKREDLNKAILNFRDALQTNDDRVNTYAQTLYQWLIKPLEADLQASNPKTLIYAPDGQLRYIPIGALHDGKQWLTERYAINIITAKSLTNLTQQPTQQPKILAGAIGGQRQEITTVTVGTRSFDFSGLPATLTEVDSIQALQPSTNLLKTTQFILPNIKPKLADYNILHLATHAAIVPGDPKDSFILFSGNTTATLREIENWTLSNFDLIVLSACETGLAGNFGENGEEILGLGYQFQNRGAKATIASLWKVADDSTQQLMTEFYTALKAGQSKTQALQTAQRSLIARTFSHPYYWAPFILIGNGL